MPFSSSCLEVRLISQASKCLKFSLWMGVSMLLLFLSSSSSSSSAETRVWLEGFDEVLRTGLRRVHMGFSRKGRRKRLWVLRGGTTRASREPVFRRRDWMDEGCGMGASNLKWARKCLRRLQSGGCAQLYYLYRCHERFAPKGPEEPEA